MKYKRKIKFTTVGHKSRLTGGVPRYQGQVKHNQVLSREDTLKGYAAYCGEREHREREHLDALGSYIASELERGNRLNFGWFGVGLRIGGERPLHEERQHTQREPAAGKPAQEGG